jgi:hypothetical protein
MFAPFLPMIIHSTLSFLSRSLAIGLALCCATKSVWKSRYTIDWITFIFMFTDAVCLLATKSTVPHMMLSPFFSAAYAVLFLTSLMGREPLTICYAKKRTPEHFWTSPLFFKVNQLLTAILGIIFIVETLFKTLRFFYPERLPYQLIFLALNVLIPIVVLVVPKWYKNRIMPKQLGEPS